MPAVVAAAGLPPEPEQRERGRREPPGREHSQMRPVQRAAPGDRILNAASRSSANGRKGNTDAIVRSHCGAVSIGWNTSEMKHSGRIVPQAIGSALSAAGTSTLTANPQAQKQNMPRANGASTAGIAFPTTSKSHMTAPAATTTRAENRATSAAAPRRPDMYTHGGSGVERSRLRMPSSRASVTRR
jgi:hypothetical protein